MSIQDLYTALTTAKFDVHFGEAPNGTSCPYIVLTDVTHPNFGADNKTFTKSTELRLRLVEAECHDWTLIDTLEDVLDKLNLPYGSTDVQVPSEGVCETYYDLAFLGGNTNAKGSLRTK